ncbi:MAG: site-2 protease family protein [Planctomycetes bacterium]|nr:site-2 protease family protein [Planctomycetota bacterium]
MDDASPLSTSSRPTAGAPTCADCGTELAPGLLACPTCRRLVNSERLKALAAEAEQARHAGDLAAALTAWRSALDLLPADSRQHEQVLLTIQGLSRQVEAGAAAPGAPTQASPSSAASASSGRMPDARSARLSQADPGASPVAAASAPRAPAAGARTGNSKGAAQAAAGLGSLALLLLSKGKMLLLGLTKGGAGLSFLLSFGVYWAAWGWKFALGILASLYVHEMGHVAVLARYGIAATAPMFVPGLGAFVRMKQRPATRREDARVGLAGPTAGAAAAIAAYLGFLAGAGPVWGVIAKLGAWINLFNLLPVWQLDGGRGFAALNRSQRWFAVFAIGAAWAISEEGLLLLLLLVALGRAAGRDAPAEPDHPMLFRYVGLLALLTALAVIHVPGAPVR